MSSNSKTDDLTETILKIINEDKPESLKQLAAILKESLDVNEEEIMKSVLKLQTEGVIKFENQAFRPSSLATYLRNGQAIWYWLTIVAEAITVVLAFTIPENFFPWIYMRNIFGLVSVLFITGYAFIRAFLPVSMPVKTSSENLDMLERIVLSIVTSIAITSLIGLLLNFSPWGIRLTPMLLSIVLFTLIFATVAVIREYNVKRMM